MKISRNDFNGTGSVYRFTLSQMLKGKANIITMLIFFLITAASIPVMTLVMGGKNAASSEEGENGAEAVGITAVYVQNDTGYDLDLENIPLTNEMFAHTEFVDTNLMDTSWSEDTYASMIQSKEAYVHLQKDIEKMCFTVGAYTLEERDFSDEDLDSCVGALSGLLDEARIVQQEAEPEQIAALTDPYMTNVQSVSEYLEEEDDHFSARFGVQMIYSVALLILCSFAASFIIQKVI